MYGKEKNPSPFNLGFIFKLHTMNLSLILSANLNKDALGIDNL